jgi:hypothetical protein
MASRDLFANAMTHCCRCRSAKCFYQPSSLPVESHLFEQQIWLGKRLLHQNRIFCCVRTVGVSISDAQACYSCADGSKGGIEVEEERIIAIIRRFSKVVAGRIKRFATSGSSRMGE